MNDVKSRWAQSFLAGLITVGFFAAMFIPMVYKGTSADDALKQTLQNMFILVIGFYFGSSSSSAKKDDIIAAASVANQGPTDDKGTPVVKIDDKDPVKVQEA